MSPVGGWYLWTSLVIFGTCIVLYLHELRREVRMKRESIKYLRTAEEMCRNPDPDLPTGNQFELIRRKIHYARICLGDQGAKK